MYGGRGGKGRKEGGRVWKREMSCLSTLFTCDIRNADIHLSVKSAESPEGGVDAVGPVGGRHDDDVRALLEAVHEGEKLGDDPTLDLPVGLWGRGGKGGGGGGG